MDTERFDAATARSAWDAGADAWRRFVHEGGDYYRHAVHGPALLHACAVKTGERALDLGCGEGYFARLLAKSGARVDAIDLSARMLEHARAEERATPLGITFRLGDASRPERDYTAESFDLIASCMAIQDMSEPAACLSACARLLARTGRMVFSVPHPATDTPVREWQRDAAGGKQALCIDRYFDSGPAICQWTMPRLAYTWSTPYWRHTLGEWAAMVLDAGFLIRRMLEPRPAPEQVRADPRLEDCSRLPYFLIFELVFS